MPSGQRDQEQIHETNEFQLHLPRPSSGSPRAWNGWAIRFGATLDQAIQFRRVVDVMNGGANQFP